MKKHLKTVFLNESVGSKEEQEDLTSVQHAVDSMQSVLDTKSLDPGNPAYKDLEKALTSMRSVLVPQTTSKTTTSFGKTLPEGSEFDAAFADHSKEQDDKDEMTHKPQNDFGMKTPKGLGMDEPFKKHLQECPMMDDVYSASPESEYDIGVEPVMPMDAVEHVTIIIHPSEPAHMNVVPADVVDNSVESVSGFKPAGSPNFDERPNEVVSEAWTDTYGDPLGDLLSEPEDDEELEGEEDNLGGILKDLDDEDFGSPNPEVKPKGY